MLQLAELRVQFHRSLELDTSLDHVIYALRCGRHFPLLLMFRLAQLQTRLLQIFVCCGFLSAADESDLGLLQIFVCCRSLSASEYSLLSFFQRFLLSMHIILFFCH